MRVTKQSLLEIYAFGILAVASMMVGEWVPEFAMIVVPLAAIAFGIYLIYWFYTTKNEINTLLRIKGYSKQIPSVLWMLVPLMNLFWEYDYLMGFELATGEGNEQNAKFFAIIVALLVPVVFYPLFVQPRLNKIAEKFEVEQT